jgi:hypothetical protein
LFFCRKFKKTHKIPKYLSSQNSPTDLPPNLISEPAFWPKSFPNSVNGLRQIFTERKQNCTELPSICHHRATGGNRDRPKKWPKADAVTFRMGVVIAGENGIAAGQFLDQGGSLWACRPPLKSAKKQLGGVDAPGSSGGEGSFHQICLQTASISRVTNKVSGYFSRCGFAFTDYYVLILRH